MLDQFFGGKAWYKSVTGWGIVIFAGGIPLKDASGEVVGAIGISGGSVEEDQTVAEAGAAAF